MSWIKNLGLTLALIWGICYACNLWPHVLPWYGAGLVLSYITIAVFAFFWINRKP